MSSSSSLLSLSDEDDDDDELELLELLLELLLLESVEDDELCSSFSLKTLIGRLSSSSSSDEELDEELEDELEDELDELEERRPTVENSLVHHSEDELVGDFDPSTVSDEESHGGFSGKHSAGSSPLHMSIS